MGVGAGEALAIWSELAIKNSSVALTFNLQGQTQAQEFKTKTGELSQWISSGGVSGPILCPSHEVATQIYSTKMKKLAHFLSCLVSKSLEILD